MEKIYLNTTDLKKDNLLNPQLKKIVMLKQISIVFSLLLVAGLSESFFDSRHVIRAQSDLSDSKSY